ncbi:MAG TPA: phosphotransacetylase, partial [Methanocorpusculum sp.]|nr:phosphotransacetylase [Methanocorpusculum sp.]
MKIGIGCNTDPEKIVESILRTPIANDVICYTTAETAAAITASSVTIRTADNPAEALIDDLKSHRIDAAIRGTLPANATLSYVKKAYNMDHLRRIAFLETAHGQKFLLAPVGVDEGWTVEDKIAFVTDGRRYAHAFGLSETAVVLAGGRTGDVGRHPSVDHSILDAKEVCEKTGAVFGQMLIEDPVKSGP